MFTTLTTYAGVPAYWSWIGASVPYLVLSFVWIDGHWRAFDVGNGLVFRTRRGGLASIEELAADPGLVNRAAPPSTQPPRYTSYFEPFRVPPAPDLLRAEMQMMWPRAFFKVKRAVGLGRREWQLD